MLVASLADVISPYDYTEQAVGPRFQAPCAKFIFGTDDLGRDMLSRIIHGSRMHVVGSIFRSEPSACYRCYCWTCLWIFGKWVDRVLTFLTDLTWCIPGTILALAVVTILGKGLTNTIIAISLVAWASYARTVRAKTLSLRNMAFVETGKAFGESNTALMFRYILPNIVPSLIVMVSLNLPGTIMSTTTLSFLGLGSQPPSPDWGLAISTGISNITTAPWMSIFPGLALVYTTFGFNLIGEGLRDLLDPHMKSK